MRAAARAARGTGSAVVHAAYNIHECSTSSVTPDDVHRLLQHVGLMSDKLNIGHGNLTADIAASYSGGTISIMGSHRCSISHCP
jgi:hypothetical protein